MTDPESEWRPWGVHVSILVTALFLASVTAATLADVPAVVDTVEVQLVNVTVLATDRRGHPLLDLDRPDFRVYEDGQLVEVTNFSAPARRGPTTADSRAPSDDREEEAASIYRRPSAGVRYVVFWDELHTGPFLRKPLVKQITSVLEARLHPQDLVMVVTFDGRIHVRLPLTRDRNDLRKALRQLESPRATGDSFAGQAVRALETIQFMHEALSGKHGADLAPPESPEEQEELPVEGSAPAAFSQQVLEMRGVAGETDPCVQNVQLATQFADNTYNQVQATIAALTRFVDSFSGFPGRKVILHISDGMPLIAGGEAWEYMLDICTERGLNAGLASVVTSADRQAQGSTFNPNVIPLEMQRYDTGPAWRELGAHANRHQVALYPLQATGLSTLQPGSVSGARTSLQTAVLAHHNQQDALVILAEETGGRALLNTNDFTHDLEQMVADDQSTYELAFVPKISRPGARHTIEVVVDRPGVELRYRKSYRSRTIEESLLDRLFSCLYHGQEDNPLGVRLGVVGQAQVDKDTATVRARISVPLSNLEFMRQGADLRGFFTAYLVARDEVGRTTPVRHEVIPVDVTGVESGDRRLRKDFVYDIDFEVRRVDQEIALAVRDSVGGESSFLRTSVRVK